MELFLNREKRTCWRKKDVKSKNLNRHDFGRLWWWRRRRLILYANYTNRQYTW